MSGKLRIFDDFTTDEYVDWLFANVFKRGL